MTKEYREYEVDKLAEYYKKGESALTIFGNTETVEVLRREIQEKSAQLQNIVKGLASENIELKTTVNMMKGQLDKLRGELQIEKETRIATEDAFNKSVDLLILRIKNLEIESEIEQDEEHNQKNPLVD